jgi:hypothetical protein
LERPADGFIGYILSSKDSRIQIMFIFNLNIVSTLNFLKMALRRVYFSPGFPPEAGFPGEECAPARF